MSKGCSQHKGQQARTVTNSLVSSHWLSSPCKLCSAGRKMSGRGHCSSSACHTHNSSAALRAAIMLWHKLSQIQCVGPQPSQSFPGAPLQRCGLCPSTPAKQTGLKILRKHGINNKRAPTCWEPEFWSLPEASHCPSSSDHGIWRGGMGQAQQTPGSS